MQIGDAVNPWSRSPVSPSPKRSEHGPNTATAGVRRGDSESPPRQSPSTSQCPNQRRCRARPYIPGEATHSPGGLWYLPSRAERTLEPYSTRAPCVRGHLSAPSGQLATLSRSAPLPCSAPAFPRPGLIPQAGGKTIPSTGGCTEPGRPSGQIHGTSGRCRAVPTRRVRTRCRRGPAGRRPCPRLGGCPPAGSLRFRFRAAGGEAERKRLRHLHPTREGVAGAGPAPTGPRAGPEMEPYPEL